MRRIQVGMPLAQGVHGYEEGIRYNYTHAGHDLTIAVREPDASAAEAVRSGQAWFAIACREDAMFMLSKFGDLPWLAGHYNWWINPPVLRPDPWADLEKLNTGLSATVCLVDATDGTVAALRAVRLPLELSLTVIRTVLAQMRRPFDPWRYMEVVEPTCKSDFDARSLLPEASCMCMADASRWLPSSRIHETFCSDRTDLPVWRGHDVFNRMPYRLSLQRRLYNRQ